jgi:UDP-glucose 4-epimerase
MRALVTGGAGFIGSNLVDALIERGDSVEIVDNLSSGKRENVNARARLHVLDVREPLDGLFAELRPDVCFHLAAQADVRVSVERPDFDAEVNVIGTVRVLEAARAAGSRIVFASTGGAIYGECGDPASELDECRPLAPYGAAKLAGEGYLLTFQRLYGMSNVVLRFGNVFGPRQDPHGEAGVVAIFLGRLRDGETCQIFGDGTQERDYVYVGDVVRAALAAVEVEDGVFNVGTGQAISVLELYELCRHVAGSEAAAELAAARPGELQRSVLDVTKAERGLGWRPQTSLEEGLRQTWNWIQA